MKYLHLNMMVTGIVALAVLLAITPVAAQQAPELHKLPSYDPAVVGFRVPGEPVARTPVSPSRSSVASSRYHLANGLDVTVYGSAELASRLSTLAGEQVITLDDGRYVSVITDINDPSIYNKGDGDFHPFSEESVIDVLSGISHPGMDLDVTVYILPYPRRNLLVSSTTGNSVFLSPHVLDIHPAVCAYIVAHELGHVFHNAYMPDDSPLWNRYRWIRTITNSDIYYSGATHAYRPKEIFAEDFRVLFGGEEAAFGGRIENTSLPAPAEVAGLFEFMADIGGEVVAVIGPKVRATNYPNPFNPETEIRIVVPVNILVARERVTVRIYDVTGALVKQLYSDVPSGENLYMHWDGRDHNGTAVASANYFALIEAGDARTTLKLLLLK
ncbi:MAG: hypothetical protein KAJ37_02460 [Candidatus Krumholzibacteria bacterium]|nr:hypothetical protein [Candidatus Krumholzibacteria bacterium]